MNDWLLFGLTIAIGIVIGLALRVYLARRRKVEVERFARVSNSMSWPYFAAGTVMFLGLAAANHESLPFMLFFFAAAALQLFWTVTQFIRQKTQFGLRHLFIATTVAAVLAVLFRWMGVALFAVLGLAAGVAVFVLFVLEWSKQKQQEAGTADQGETANDSPWRRLRSSVAECWSSLSKWQKRIALVVAAPLVLWLLYNVFAAAYFENAARPLEIRRAWASRVTLRTGGGRNQITGTLAAADMIFTDGRFRFRVTVVKQLKGYKRPLIQSVVLDPWELDTIEVLEKNLNAADMLGKEW